MKTLIGMVLSLVLVGCGGSGGGGDATALVDTSAGVHINCADVHNGGNSNRCDPPPVVWLDYLMGTAHAAIEVNVGDVSRDSVERVHSRTDVTNPGLEKVVFVEMRFDANCGGQPGDWVIYTKQPQRVRGAQTVRLDIGGMCGDMPLGPRTLTTTIWDTDGTTVIDFAVVRFTLI